MCKDTCFFLYCKLFPKKNTVIGSDVPLMKQSVGRSCNIVRIFVSGRFGAVGTVSGYSPHNGRNGLIRRDSHGCRAESVAGSCRDRTPYAAAVGVDGRGDADCRMMHRNPIGFVPRISGAGNVRAGSAQRWNRSVRRRMKRTSGSGMKRNSGMKSLFHQSGTMQRRPRRKARNPRRAQLSGEIKAPQR